MRKLAVLPVLLLALALAPGAGAYPGANGDIVYQRLFRGGSEIFSVDPSTGEDQRLTSNRIKSGRDVAAGHPAYSADGRRIVFMNAMKNGRGPRRNNLFVMRADGSHVRRLTRSPNHQVCPAFSPDGSTIAFYEAGNIWTIDAGDGRSRTNLTSGFAGGGGCPSYSPDGSRIAFGGWGGHDGDVFVMNADGTGAVDVTPSVDLSESQPAFSPDGTKIAFVGYAPGDFHGQLYVMNADGSDVHAVTARPEVEHYDPAFSPDGTQLVYTSRRSPRSGVDVFTVGVGGGTESAVSGIDGPIPQNPDWGVAAP